jgi:lipoyl(octanoyl) transferase
MPKLIFNDLGRINYADAFEFQSRLFNDKIAEKKAGKKPENHVLWCEHPHVYTLGNSGDQNNLLVDENFLRKIQASYFKSNRGGDITYHGPGQLVGYPIIDLDQFNIGVKDYVYKLESAVSELIADYGLSGEIKKGAAGVWLDVGQTDERKICAVGVKVSRGISMHGFALNINTDLTYFNHINPCGFVDKKATSLEKETGRIISLNEVKVKLEKVLSKTLNSKERTVKHFK